MKRESLFFRFLWPISLILVVGAFVSSYFFYKVHNDAILELNKQREEFNYKQIEQDIKNLVEAPKRINDHLSFEISNSKNGVKDLSWIRGRLYEELVDHPEIDSLFFGTESNELVGYLKFLDKRINLFICGKETKGAINMYEIDDHGRPTKLIKSTPNFSVKTRPWYLNAILKNKFNWGDIFSYVSYPVKAIPASAPIYRDGKLLGVLGSNLFLLKLSNTLKKLSIGKDDRLYILDNNNKLIASNLINVTEKYHISSIKEPDSINGLKDPISKKIYRELSEGKVLNKDDLLKLKVEKFQGEELPQLKFVFYHSDNESSIRLNKDKTKFFIIVLVTIFLAIAFLSILLRKLIAPVKHVDSIIKDIATGKEVESINYPYNDEIGSMIFSLNNLVKDLSSKNNEIETINDRFNLALEATSIGVWDWDVKNNILVWDDQMYQLYGINKKDFSSAYEAWASALHPDDKEETERIMDNAFKGISPYNPKFRVVTPSGYIRYLEAAAKVFRDENGAPIRMIGVNRDITSEIEQKSKIQQTNDDLAQFTYRTSHDLKSPLTSSMGLMNIIKEDIKDENYREVDKNIIRLSSIMNNIFKLTKDMLDLSKSNLGEFSIEEVNLEEMIQVIYDQINFSGDKINFNLECLLKNKNIKAETERLKSIFTNLISNSIKYRDQNKSESFIKISITENENEIKFVVSDNGIGFPKDFQNKVFELFSRFHEGSFEGSGLGLSIVKRHVESMGGAISIESSPSNGTYISFSMLKEV